MRKITHLEISESRAAAAGLSTSSSYAVSSAAAMSAILSMPTEEGCTFCAGVADFFCSDGLGETL